MEGVSEKVKAETVQSFRSTIRKLENAFDQMSGKGANTTLVEKRLRAMKTGLVVLDAAWHQKPLQCGSRDISMTRTVLEGLLPSVGEAYTRSKEGSPQRTLLKRRIRSIELAIQAMDELDEGQLPHVRDGFNDR